MPSAVAGFVGSILVGATQALASVIGTTAAVFVVDVGIKLAAMSFLDSVYRALVGTPDFAREAQGQTLTVRGTLQHQRIVYGKTLVSGPVAYFNAAGTHNQAMYKAIMLAGHEIEDVTDVWLDDAAIPNAAIDWGGNGSVDSGDFRGDVGEQEVVYFEKNLGAEDQSASNFLTNAFADITSQHQGRGIAHLVARTDYFEGQTQVWSAGAVQNYRALVTGKKVYNPCSDSTQTFGTGPHRLTNSLTWEWSDKGPLIWADYMIDSKLGFGKEGCTTDDIDYGSVASATAVCSGVVFTPVGTDHRFRTNGVLNTGDTYKRNIQKILSSFNGMMTHRNGKFRVRAWSYETPTLSYDQGDVRGGAQFRFQSPDAETYNTVRGYFVDPDRLYAASQFPEFTSSEYQARDGGKFYKDLELPMTTNVFQAQRIAAGVLEQSDLQTSVLLPARYTVAPAEIGGTIALTYDKPNYDGETFRVLRYKFSDLGQGAGGVSIVARIDPSEAYTDVGTAEYSVPNSTGGYATADPGVPAPSSLVATQNPNGNFLQWINPPGRLYEWTELWAAEVNSRGDSSLRRLTRTKADEFLDVRAQDARRYWYWVRAENFTGELSAWHPSSGLQGVNAYTRPRPQNNMVIDPEFDLSTFINDVSSGDFWQVDVLQGYWMSTVLDQSNPVNSPSAVLFQSSLGINGSNSVKFFKGDPADSPQRQNLALKQTMPFVHNAPYFNVAMTWRNMGPGTFENMTVRVRGWVGVNSSVVAFATLDHDFTTTAGSEWTTTVFSLGTTNADPRAKYWAVELITAAISSPGQELEINNIYVMPIQAPSVT